MCVSNEPLKLLSVVWVLFWFVFLASMIGHFWEMFPLKLQQLVGVATETLLF